MCAADGDGCSAYVIDDIRTEILRELEISVAKPLLGAIDEYNLDNVPGWLEYMKARDSEDPAERKRAQKGVTAVKFLKEDGIYPDVLLAKYGRSVQHGSSDLFPLGIMNIGWIMKAVGDSMPEENMKYFFYSNFSAVLLEEHAKDIHGTTIRDVERWAHDVSHMLDIDVPRLEKLWLHINESRAGWTTIFYLLGSAVAALMVHLSSGTDQR